MSAVRKVRRRFEYSARCSFSDTIGARCLLPNRGEIRTTGRFFFFFFGYSVEIETHALEDEVLDVAGRALDGGVRVAGRDHQEQESRQGIHVVVSIGDFRFNSVQHSKFLSSCPVPPRALACKQHVAS